VGEIGPNQEVPLTFLVKAPDKPGIYFPELHISTDGGRSLRYPIPVNVNDDSLVQRNPALQIHKELPSSIIPGDDAQGILILRNLGETAANEVIVNISSITPELSLTSPVITHHPRIAPGEEVQIPLTFTTSRSLSEGIASLNCMVHFSTASGTQCEQTEQIPVKITGKPELSIASVTTDPIHLSEGTPFSLIVRIENTGTSDANGVRVIISGPVKGTREAFVGKIEPDNDGPAIFYLQGAPAGDNTLPVTIQMEHEGETTRISDTISLAVPSRNNPYLVPVVLILVIVGSSSVLYYRRRSEKKE
jgi:hypothetical protein